MGRQFRRYCYNLAERLGLSVKELLEKLDSHELSEWMAYDMTNNSEWQAKYAREKELEQSRSMAPEDKLKAFKRLFKGK